MIQVDCRLDAFSVKYARGGKSHAYIPAIHVYMYISFSLGQSRHEIFKICESSNSRLLLLFTWSLGGETREGKYSSLKNGDKREKCRKFMNKN